MIGRTSARGIEFEVVPEQQEPPPEEGGDSQKSTANASPGTVAETSDRSEVKTMGEWQRALREAELTSIEQHIGLMLSTWMNFSTKDGQKVDTAYGQGHSLSQETVAEKSGRTVKTVRRAIAGLEREGYLYVHRRPGRSSIYGAALPTGATVHPLPTPDTRAGGPRTPEQGDPGHQRPTAYYPEYTDITAAANPSLTELAEEQVDSRALELAQAETSRRIEAGSHIGSHDGYARKIAPDFRDQARSELTNELQREAIQQCSRCDANGFIDVSDTTRGRCDHRRTA